MQWLILGIQNATADMRPHTVGYSVFIKHAGVECEQKLLKFTDGLSSSHSHKPLNKREKKK